MASTYGVPDGSSLADWPIRYDDLAPDYDRAEWETGRVPATRPARVAGRAAGATRCRRCRRTAPTVLRRGGDALGLPPRRSPLLINTVPYDGRGACVQCGACVGFACPPTQERHAQHRDPTRPRHRPLRPADRRDRWSGITAAERPVSGVRSSRRMRAADTPARRRPSGGCGAARSRPRGCCSTQRPGQRRTTRSAVTCRATTTPPRIGSSTRRPGLASARARPSPRPTTATATRRDRRRHAGGRLRAMLPTIFMKFAVPPTVPRWGAPAKHVMRELSVALTKVIGPVQEIPTADSASRSPRSPTASACRWPGSQAHRTPETARTAEFIRERAVEWLAASGASRTGHAADPPAVGAGQHQAGTCRMGTDPAHVGDRLEGPRLGSQQPLRRRRLAARHQRRLQPGADDPGPRVAGQRTARRGSRLTGRPHSYERPRLDASRGAAPSARLVPRKVPRIGHAPGFRRASRSTTTGRSSSRRLRSLIRSR